MQLAVRLTLFLAGLAMPFDGLQSTTASELSPPAETCTVARVVDGDTLEVQIGDRREKVRLIGVDTPESVHPLKPVEYFARESAEFVRGLVNGIRVRMTGEDGTPDRDRYGRLLRYVYLEDGRLLNGEIIVQGYGSALVKYPFRKMEEFRAFEQQARDEHRGLWNVSQQPVQGTLSEEKRE